MKITQDTRGSKAVSTLVGGGIKYQIKKLPRSLAVCFYSLINDAVCTYISNII